MDRILEQAKKAQWIKHTAKVVAVAASSGAALVSIITALVSYGVIGQAESHQSIGNIGAAWVGLRPGMDTATALGDTVHFAATVTDRNGSILVGARPTWTTGDPTIAMVLQDGSVIARGPGRTMVSVVVGKLIAHSTVIVRQKVANVDVGRVTGDSTIVLPEGSQLQLRARAMDARGYPIAGLEPTWHIDDTTVAALDSNGLLTARSAGRTMIGARIDGVADRTSVSVVTPASAIVVVAGGNQRALAAKTLPQPLVVRATNRHGTAAAGKRVTFRLAEGEGSVDPASAITDADGRARATWTLGADPGRQTLFATVENVDSALAVVAEADPIASNTRATPLAERLSGPAGQELADSVAVRITDSTGRARATWTLGADPGRQTLFATVENVDSALAVVAEADPIASNTRATPLAERLSGPAGQELADSVAVRITDSTGRALPDVPVRWTPVDGGSVEVASARTDSLGVASARWTLSRKTGTQRLRAQVGVGPGLGIPPLTFTALALAGAPASIVASSGDNQRAAAGMVLRSALVFRVLDANGSGVAEAALSLSASGGVLSDSALTTDSLGVARTRWTMGHSAGDYSLAVSVEGVKKLLKIVAHATPAVAANLAFDDVPGDKKLKESAKNKRLYALVTDIYGNPVPDAKVSFSVKSGTVTPTRAVSDAKGRAALTWKLGSKAGEQTLKGVVRGTDVAGEYVTQVGPREALAKPASLRSASK